MTPLNCFASIEMATSWMVQGLENTADGVTHTISAFPCIAVSDQYRNVGPSVLMLLNRSSTLILVYIVLHEWVRLALAAHSTPHPSSPTRTLFVFDPKIAFGWALAALFFHLV